LWPEFKGWEKVFVTPKFHQIHHSSVHDHLDTNYGGMFTIWDRIFGTYHFDDQSIKYGLTKPIEQQDPFHIQILFFMKLLKNFKVYSFKKAFLLLFMGPEAQTQDMPRVYNIPVNHHKIRVIVGFIIFLIGYITLSLQLLPTWLAFVIGMLGIFICSGLVFILINNRRYHLTKHHA
jgi:hypothetical protein